MGSFPIQSGIAGILKNIGEQRKKKAMEDTLDRARAKGYDIDIELDPTTGQAKYNLKYKGKTQAEQAKDLLEVEMLKSIIGGGQGQGNGQRQTQGGGFRPKGFTYGGMNFERMPTEEEYQEEINRKTQEELSKENIKPYGDVEAGIISKAELLSPEIDKLTKMLRENKVYEGLGVPFGASRISSFGEKGLMPSIRRGFTAGKGREAGLLLQKIKTLAFGEGGKALTEGEKAVIMPLLNPAYKTEEQWTDDLEYAKNLLIRKAQLVQKGTSKDINIKKSGGQLMIDVNGNKAMVYPDGSFEEVR